MSRQTLSYRMPSELVAGLYSAVISLLLITLINGIPTPKDSHYFVSRLPFYLGKDEQIITLYGFLRAPIYELIDWIYWLITLAIIDQNISRKLKKKTWNT